MRTAGSHGPFDVIAIGALGVRLIQVKRAMGNNWKYEYEAAKEEIEFLPKFPFVSYEIWVWQDGIGWVKQEKVG
jgi:Holliday junction resolvase